ncbi:hypothetical protein [Rathayibacter sp. VKM Ac-2760]|uniref:hypothetical protein n=1 Tax=Rathayibacter sp. VKM Ac-2760 TaxID=2609253 RepID=UPI0013175CEB|nr:hypothetical protein [Rathayibacter sp. VKM Ac-2760]QHC61144.1 hypothetical protein GSU72_20640 [Rathayibacter sp. VKM Ac-2760]
MNFTNKRRILLFSVALASISMAGCSSSAGVTPTPSETSYMHGDYPAYDLNTLNNEAAQIVEVKVESAVNTTIYPEFIGDDPLINPLAGASEEEIAQAREDASLPGTEVRMRVTETHKGPASVGSEIVIVQTGGVVDNTLYVDDQSPILAEGEEYFLFLSSVDNPYILGGGAGSYETKDDSFVAISDLAPVAEFAVNDSNEIESSEGVILIE